MLFWIDNFFELSSCHGYNLGENVDNLFDIKIVYILEIRGSSLFFRSDEFGVEREIVFNHKEFSTIEQIEKCVSECLKNYMEKDGNG